MIKEPYKIIKRPILTEKSSILSDEQNVYVFEVMKNANKIEIKNAIEQLFKVKVVDVNTLIQRGKKKRVRFKEGRTSSFKKAYVKLAEGDKIDFYEGV